jgi:hypothetical protein
VEEDGTDERHRVLRGQGPEDPGPEILRPVLDALRGAPCSTSAIEPRVQRRVMDRLRRRLEEEGHPAPDQEDEEAEASTTPRPHAPEGAGALAAAPASSYAHLASTEPFDLPAELRGQAGKLPFKDPSEVPRIPRTAQSARAPATLGGTAPMTADEIAQAKARAALPFTGATESSSGAGAVSFPQLQLHAYAWLCAQLSAHPGAEEQILALYQVPDRRSREALDAHWKEAFITQPGAWQQFSRLLMEYGPKAREQRR